MERRGCVTIGRGEGNLMDGQRAGQRHIPLRRSRARGMTLVEVATIIVILSILSVIGVVAYRRYVAASRTHEATNMLGSIRAAQFEYKAERGVFASVSVNIDSYYPNPTPGAQLTQWGGPCGNCTDPMAWHKLKVTPSGPVRFGYATVDGVGGRTPPPRVSHAAAEVNEGLSSMGGSIKPTEPFFVAVASADTDGDGTSCVAMANSHSNAIVISNEGE